MIDVQEFLADGTWTKPVGAVLVHVYLIGGGGSGKSGEWGGVSTQRSGGPGGGGGGVSVSWVPASLLPSTVDVVVGQGGAARVGSTTLNVEGTAGAAGTASTFTAAGKDYARAGAGGGGGPGQLTNGTGGNGSLVDGLSGGEGNTSAEGPDEGFANTLRYLRPGGGGSGAGQPAGTNAGLAGRVGTTNTGVDSWTASTGGAGATVGDAGHATISPDFFAGGGGGGFSGAGNGGNGADGTFPGGGGGGGGAGSDSTGTHGGDSGAGADGVVIVTSYG